MGPIEAGFRSAQLYRGALGYAYQGGTSSILAGSLGETLGSATRVCLADPEYCKTSLTHLEFFGQAVPKELGWSSRYPDTNEAALLRRPYFLCSPRGYRGAVKNFYEINKLYHLPRLSLAYAHTHDLLFANALVSDLCDWDQDNLYLQGLNWRSGIELSFRLANVVVALMILSKFHRIDLSRFVPFIARTLTQIRNTKSKYSSVGNHSIVEIAGELFGEYFLWHVGSRELPNLTVIDHELAGLLESQVSVTGTGTENSFTYNMLNLEAGLWSLVLFRIFGYSASGLAIERLSAALAFTLDLCDEEFNAPRFGDDDSACFFKVVRDTDLETAGRISNLRSLAINLGFLKDAPRERSNFDALLEAFCPASGSTIVPTPVEVKKFEKSRVIGGKIAVVVDKKETSKVVNLTKTYSHPPFFGHAHNDCNSIWWSYNGTPILSDPGSYSYTRKKHRRNEFRSTRNHSTFWLEGVVESNFIAPFILKPNCESTILNVSDEGDFLCVTSERKYFTPSDLLVQREVRICGKRIEVIDEIVKGTGSGELRHAFVFSPAVKLLKVPGRDVAELRFLSFSLMFSTSGRIMYHNECQRLFTGYSSRFNALETVPRLEVSSGGSQVCSTLELVC